jgi:Zn-finger nucleic acid-binding protein
MKCPLCNTDLLMGERLTVQIDYCPKCRGIWLDNGKLDKIIESSTLTPSTRRREDRDDDDDNNSILGRLGQLFD